MRFSIPVLAVTIGCLAPVTARSQNKAPVAAASCSPQNPNLLSSLSSIKADDLKADLSFLSADSLMGRSSPSPGLDIAADFIASRFRGAGLEAGGSEEYFQSAVLEDGVPKPPDPTSGSQGRVRNVVAILRGSDLKLRDTYVLLTAHYDHIGTTETAGREAADHPAADNSDHIYNGANDDGSGTVSVLAVARALSKIRPRPKRSIVFILFFGEELGLRGSRFYVEHPMFPLSHTVAELNLEQVGRTDSTEGPQIAAASLTGTGYSGVTAKLRCAGLQSGVRLYLDKGNDDYFVRSDNASFAKKGIPAHTLCVAFDFPDYHRVGDEWQKIDYANMAKIDRMVALGILNIANDVRKPEWNAENPKTEPFREAQLKLNESDHRLAVHSSSNR